MIIDFPSFQHWKHASPSNALTSSNEALFPTPESHVFVPIFSKLNLLHITPTSFLHLGAQIEDPFEYCLLSMTALRRQIWEAVSVKEVTELTGTVFFEARDLGIT